MDFLLFLLLPVVLSLPPPDTEPGSFQHSYRMNFGADHEVQIEELNTDNAAQKSTASWTAASSETGAGTTGTTPQAMIIVAVVAIAAFVGLVAALIRRSQTVKKNEATKENQETPSV
jgi:hypothetical protein